MENIIEGVEKKLVLDQQPLENLINRYVIFLIINLQKML